MVDPRPYEVALQNANGTLAKDEALLKNAQIDLQRYQTLVRQESIARQQLDTQAALVRQYEAQLITDRAIVDNAKLNLAYTRIIAPVTGRIGLRLVDKGNYVTMGDADGHLRHHPDAADLGDVHDPGGRAAAGAQAPARGRHPAGDGARPVAEEPARPRQARRPSTTRSTRPPAR